MKKIILIILFFLLTKVNAQVVITAATGGTNISADKAANAAVPSYITIGNIKIAESSVNDFAPSQTGVTFILSAPTNWSFKNTTGAMAHTAHGSFTSITMAVTPAAITVTFSTGSTSALDTITISGIQVQATDGGIIPSSGNITRTGGTSTIAGFTNKGGNNCGSLSQVLGAFNHFAINTISSPQIVSVAFSITITAQDQFNNTVTSFVSSSTLSTNTTSISPTNTGNFSLGTKTLNVTLTGVNASTTITVVNGSKTKTSNIFALNAAVGTPLLPKHFHFY